MNLGKESLTNLLMEEGEEDLAVRVAFSDLPERLDTDRDAAALAELGLDRDELLALLPSVTGGAAAPSRASAEDAAALDRTISKRWADLVSRWTAGH